jgi:hypothetical protein
MAAAPFTMSTPSPALPYEVLDIVARFLIGDNAFQSCANLNTASHAVRDATLQTLWTHMYWTKFHDSKKYKREEVEAKWNIFKASQGSRYIRQVQSISVRIGDADGSPQVYDRTISSHFSDRRPEALCHLLLHQCTPQGLNLG